MEMIQAFGSQVLDHGASTEGQGWRGRGFQEREMGGKDPQRDSGAPMKKQFLDRSSAIRFCFDIPYQDKPSNIAHLFSTESASSHVLEDLSEFSNRRDYLTFHVLKKAKG